MKKTPKNKNKNKTGLKRKLHFVFVNFNPIDTTDILDINKYLMKKKHNTKQCLV